MSRWSPYPANFFTNLGYFKSHRPFGFLVCFFLGLPFAIVGAGLVGTAIAEFVHGVPPAIGTKPEAGPGLTAFMGGILLAIALSLPWNFAYRYLLRLNGIRRLRASGERVFATVQRVEGGSRYYPTGGRAGMTHHFIFAIGREIGSDETKQYVSDPLPGNPNDKVIGQSVTVYVDPQDHETYFVNVVELGY